MVRRQIVALSLGGSLAVIGVLAWLGLPLLKHSSVSKASLPVKSSATHPKVAAVPVAPVVPKKPQTNGVASADVPSHPAAAPVVAAAKPVQTVPAAAPVAEKPILPQFDTVRVEPSGESVVAGHGAPGANIDLMAGDKIIGQVQADKGSGDFVIVPKALDPGNYVLALRSQSGAQAAVQSRQTITVSVPAKGQKRVAVALTEPGKASVLLADPTAKQAPKQAPQPVVAAKEAKAPATPSVAFKTVEADKGAFYTTGLAPPGTHVQIYLNGSHLADVVADADGHWSLTVPKGMTGGHYAVRADAIDSAGKVVARAEVPFDMPMATIEAKLEDKAPLVKSEQQSKQEMTSESPSATAEHPKQAIAAPTTKLTAREPSQATPSKAVVEISTATVQRGDSLWRISRKTFGRGIRYTLIYAANAKQIRDPNLIYPGQVFVLPHPPH